MMRKPKVSPSWCKWWMDDWRTSSLRKRLRTPAQRYAYREFWDLCMSSPDPGAAVDSSGEPYTDQEICAEIGCRIDVFRRMVETAERLGRVTRGARDERRLDSRSAEKSLPDHWKYKRLRGESSDSGQIDDTPRQRQKQRQRKESTRAVAREHRHRDVHADAFKVAFDAYFGEEYEFRKADFVCLARWRKSHADVAPERFVEVAQYHWGQGEFTPRNALTIRGVASDWTTLVAKMNHQKPRGGANRIAPPSDFSHTEEAVVEL